MKKRFKKILAGALMAMTLCSSAFAADPNIPVEARTGETSVVYFTRDLSAEGLKKIYDKVASKVSGKVAIKVHTGEKNGPNIIPREWVKNVQVNIPNSVIVETNTYYKGDRYTTEDHRETLAVNGWDFCPVDIMDEFGTTMLPVNGGKYFTQMSVGASLPTYDSLVVLTHFKGHTMGGFGGSNKNIGIGCADGRIGKGMIHTGDDQTEWDKDPHRWQVTMDEFMERMTESTKATVDHFGDKIVYINVLRNMSVDCDCAGVGAQAPNLPDIGIFASLDILAVDQASVDKVYTLFNEYPQDLKERIESRHGLRQLSYMKELGMGNDKYTIVDLDQE